MTRPQTELIIQNVCLLQSMPACSIRNRSGGALDRLARAFCFSSSSFSVSETVLRRLAASLARARAAESLPSALIRPSRCWTRFSVWMRP
jgi:hypothetical protein